MSDSQNQPEPLEPANTVLEAELEALESAPVVEPESPAVEQKSGGEPVIVFSHVSIGFGEHLVLEDVSFCVNRGETLCILGRSGVGKSVSLRLLMGFLKPDSGSIQVEGQEISDLDEEGMRAIRKRVTMVFQNGALFDSLSVRENVAFPFARAAGSPTSRLKNSWTG